jgi:DNA repair protein RecO (recombination protein O)
MSSSLYQTTGIVLSRRDHKEVDRGYAVFTRELGKIEFLARGGHKPLAKLTPHLETAAELNLLIVRGRVFQTVAGVDRIRAFSNIYNNLSLTLLTQNALHLVDIGTRPEEQDEGIYDLLLDWLEFLNKGFELPSERSAYLLGSFTLKLLALVGYLPELYNCLGCEQSIAQGEYRWHSLKGGVVCQSCVRKDEQQWFSARPMKDETLKLLRFALKKPFEEQLKLHLPGTILLDFHDCIESLIISHFPTIPANSLRAACIH